jgi:hypothetical protein
MRYVITTIYKGQRKFIFRAGRHSVAVDSVNDADCFDDIDSACEAAFRERSYKHWRGFSWHEAAHPLDVLDGQPEPDDREICDPIASQRMDAADVERMG